MPEPVVYGAPPGVDFAAALAAHLRRLSEDDPIRLAKMTVLLNADRMRRRVRAALADGGATLLPRLLLVTEIDQLLPPGALPPATSPLRRRLELARLVERLIEADPTLAPRASIFDLADSLAALLDEMHGEGISPETVAALDVTDESGHWQRSVRFLGIVRTFLDATTRDALDPEARRVLAVAKLECLWAETPPENPVLVAGSTGSRGTTLRLIRAVAALPTGQIILPGVDPFTPEPVENGLSDGTFPEDHPQARIAALLDAVGCRLGQVRPLEIDAPDELRNRLVSLALRPAPVTTQWLAEGPALGNLVEATRHVTLLEPDTPRHEAETIALVARHALNEGRSVAIITPDRTLTRQIEAGLARWAVEPDDSAGKPLAQSPPGRLIRLTLAALGNAVRPLDLIGLLTHPLTATGGERGPHLLNTRRLDLALRETGRPVVSPTSVRDLDVGDEAWRNWVAEIVESLAYPSGPNLDRRLDHLRGTVERLAAGPDAEGSGELWQQAAGRDADAALGQLTEAAPGYGPISTGDLKHLVETTLSAANVRAPDVAHPDVMIWGTLEARVQGADLVILAGLNDGVWPAKPAADPWLNRRLRKDAGLLLPERQIGLSAHDFQQAAAAPEIMLSRARRDAEAETVPSRWLNRLLNLVAGLPGQGGDAALEAMRERGRRWLVAARQLDTPSAESRAALRPSPAPPRRARPTELSISDVQSLIRDPYAVYARRVLKLRRLNALDPRPDARVRGEALHTVMEAFVQGLTNGTVPLNPDALADLAHDIMTKTVPWPAMAQTWAARLRRIAPDLVAAERLRRDGITKSWTELKGRLDVPETGVRIIGRADRIDVGQDGRLTIWDYKSGGTKSAKEVKHFEPQLLIEAVMAEAGGFAELGPATVAAVGYIGLSTQAKSNLILLDDGPDHDFRVSTVAAELTRLLQAYFEPTQGYTSRRAMARMRFEGDYDHLARAGEWDDTADAETEVFE